MFDLPPGNEIVLQTDRRKHFQESRLVLEAVGIPVDVYQNDGEWALVVDGAFAEKAREELATYQAESSSATASPPKRFVPRPGAWPGVVGYVSIIVILFYWSMQAAFGLDWFGAGEMRADKAFAGEWWRLFTALTLHVDFGHIFSNVVFGSLFGLLAGQAFGGGVAWLAILLAGGLGNYLAALVKVAPAPSIGASTAAFAALGIIAAHSLHSTLKDPGGSLKRWSPLIGGLMLFAFLGVGDERTDTTAHFTGGLTGMLVGAALQCLPGSFIRSKFAQQLCGFASLALLITAWVLAFVLAT